MRAASVLLCFALVLAAGCDKPKGPAPAVVSIGTATAPATASAAAPARGRAYHYDLTQTITEGMTKTQSSFSLDLAEGHGGVARLGKNVILGSNARSDVGTKAKGSLTMEGDVPRLELEAEISAVDAAGKVFHLTPKGAAATPMGKATTVIDVTDAGRHVELTATPSAAADLGAEANVDGAATLDIVASHTGGSEPKTTPMSLTISGNAPAVASKTETKPLQVVDGGGMSPRVDTGTRVKVKGAEPRSGGMALDFDIELSDTEPATPASRMRKITSSGSALVPWDKPTVLLAATDDANQYTITATLHRPK